jgi:hypothetical protein
MADQPFKSPVGDTVPRVDDQIAVGEDLEFQRKWWRFERIVWSIFVVILICDLLGLFGRGWLAKATQTTPDGALKLNYERIERADTPSIMTLHFNDAAIQDGKIHLFVSESVTRPLGAQRIAPEPMISAVGDAGNTYTFAATHGPATVQIALEPSFPGEHHFHIELLGEPSGGESIDGSVFVVP